MLEKQRPEEPVQKTSDFSKYFEAEIINQTGLHARPAAELVKLSKQYQSQIRVRHGDKVADAKRLVSILKLGAGNGAKVIVSADLLIDKMVTRGCHFSNF